MKTVPNVAVFCPTFINGDPLSIYVLWMGVIGWAPAPNGSCPPQKTKTNQRLQQQNTTNNLKEEEKQDRKIKREDNSRKVAKVHKMETNGNKNHQYHCFWRPHWESFWASYVLAGILLHSNILKLKFCEMFTNLLKLYTLLFFCKGGTKQNSLKSENVLKMCHLCICYL